MNEFCEEREQKDRGRAEEGRTYLLKKEGKDEPKVEGYLKIIVG